MLSLLSRDVLLSAYDGRSRQRLNDDLKAVDTVQWGHTRGVERQAMWLGEALRQVTRASTLAATAAAVTVR